MMKHSLSLFMIGIACLSLHPLIAQTPESAPSPSPSAPPPAFSQTPTEPMASLVPKSTTAPTPPLVPTVIPKPSTSPTASPAPTKKVPMKPASKLIKKQQPGVVMKDVLKQAATAPIAIHVSLSAQRAYVLVGGVVAIDSPISSGKKDGWTPKGEFMVLEKDPDHHSNLYGDFINEGGKVVRSGISSKLDVAPSGTHYRGASMKYFLRLTPEGVGMHVGILPGYPASHGCIRLPLDMAQLIYNTVPVKTPVSVTD